MDNRNVSKPYKYKLLKENTSSESGELKEDASRMTWKSDVYWQFGNTEARELYSKKPIIEWQLSPRASLLFSQGLKPDQFNSQSPFRGQGYVIIIAFVKTENEMLGGIVELVPTCNAGDNLPRTTADGKPFESNGINMLVETKDPLSGNTGRAHLKGSEKLNESNALVKDWDKDHPCYIYPTKMGSGSTTRGGGGLFVGSDDLIGEYRVNSGFLNIGTFPINPLFTRSFCDQELEEVPGSAFWFKRKLPKEISDSLLGFLLNELPLKEHQVRKLAKDYRQTESNKILTEKIDLWLSMSLSEKKALLEERLIYLAQLKEKKGEPAYSLASLIHESKQQGIELDVNYKDKAGRTALSYYLENKTYDEKKQENIKSIDSDIQALIAAGADFFISDESKKRPLDYDTRGTGFSALCNIAQNAHLRSQRKLASDLLKKYFTTKLNIDSKTINIREKDPRTEEALIFTIIDTCPELMKDIARSIAGNVETFNIVDKNNRNPLERLLTKKTIHAADYECFLVLQKKLSLSSCKCKLDEIAPQFRPYVQNTFSTGQPLFSSSVSQEPSASATDKVDKSIVNKS